MNALSRSQANNMATNHLWIWEIVSFSRTTPAEQVRWLFKATGETLSRKHLLQRITIAVQRGNTAAVLSSMGKPQLQSWEWLCISMMLLFFLNIRY